MNEFLERSAGRVDYKLDQLAGKILQHGPIGKKALLNSGLLNFRFLPDNRKLATAIAATYQHEIHIALKHLVHLLATKPDHLLALENTGYLLFHLANRDVRENIWVLFQETGLTKHADENHTGLLRLILALMISLDIENAERNVQRIYLEKVVTPSVRRKFTRPIFFWHVPKCSGTSINEIFCRYFYKHRENIILPSYTCLPLLELCLLKYSDYFPYITSAHVDSEMIKSPENAFTFAVFRDPVKRVLSMFKQSRMALTHGFLFRLFHSYGYHWDKWRTTEFGPWLKILPPALLLRQLTTFSPTCEVSAATHAIKTLNYYLIHDYNCGSFDELFKRINIPLTASDIPKDLNKSPKGPEITRAERDEIYQLLSKEYELISQLVE